MRDEMKKVPRLRFRGFQEDWELCKLGDVADHFEYGLNASAIEYDGKNKYLRITDIDDSSR
ncbi:restriction endonuclease subunit S, partial [Enterococcus faecalis]|nr:restriction endonuclease subunit S [Enterococcus faecalis]NSS82067.1 restriction endonuclease subunit S [Enterococcus faecalis]NSS84915.1 restriction endonuclease subunit S [Enterococcus faecalis]NSS95999.1 restriction endonuclease subunit S [Enterococcus faecalis]NST09964.1 restriction endonuclease subunit S [Enterococcus faecalis]